MFLFGTFFCLLPFFPWGRASVSQALLALPHAVAAILVPGKLMLVFSVQGTVVQEAFSFPGIVGPGVMFREVDIHLVANIPE
jgi:uncharacterized membrane protein